MKIGLVNVAGRLATGDGSRLISALLKRDGHRVTSVYLSRTEPLSYARSELALLHGVCCPGGGGAVPELGARLERGGDWKGTPNFAFLEGGHVVKNTVLPPFRDLDGLPYYDYDPEDQHLLHG